MRKKRAPSALILRGLAAEHPASKRAVGEKCHSIATTSRQDFEFDRAPHEIVDALLGDETEEMTRARNLLRLRDMPSREIGASDIEHLALLDEQLHRLPYLFPARAPINVMHLIEIDVVGSQPRQACLASFAN